MAKKPVEKKKATPKTEGPKEAVPAPPRSARALAKYLRISPRKVRLVINAIRRKPVRHATAILMNLPQKAARLTAKVLKSAVANARVKQLEEGRLVVSDIRADGGPTLKRFLTRSMGRADRILKRTTHLSVVLTEGTKNWGEAPPAPAAGSEEKKPKAGKAAAVSRKREASAGA